MKKKILVIGAGWEQAALIQEAKKQGHEIIATHPAMTPEGLELADVFFVRDSRDIEAHLQIAKTYKVDAVLTDNCDYSFQTASFVTKALGLPFAAIQSAKYSNNKYAQRVACAKGEVTQPEFYLVENIEEVTAAANQLAYPLIMKPVDSRGTFGVTIVKNAEGLQNAFFDAMINSPSRRVICEKFIKGTLVTVDGFCFKNGHQALTVASRVFIEGVKPVTKEIIYPAQFDDSVNEALLKNHNKVVKALDYQYGHTHGEYILTDKNEMYLVECANRGGGVYTSSTIVPQLTGINLNEILVNQSLGQDDYMVSASEKGYMTKSIILTFLDFEVGKVIKSLNVKALEALDYVLHYRSVFDEKDMVESVQDCATRHSMLVLEGKDASTAYLNLEDFKSKMNVEYYDL